MDDLDKKILALLRKNARITVKDIAQHISLTSPAVSERIKRMEKCGIIAGYTVIEGLPADISRIDALISVSVPTTDRETFLQMMQDQPAVQLCYHVTGSYSYIAKVSCADMPQLERLINRLQKLGQTSTQIILSTPVNSPEIFV